MYNTITCATNYVRDTHKVTALLVGWLVELSNVHEAGRERACINLALIGLDVDSLYLFYSRDTLQPRKGSK